MSAGSMNPGGPVLGRWEQPFEKMLGGFAALILAAVMLLTCADVAGRYVLNEPVPGALEVTELMMGALIFTSLPLVTLRQQQVTIDLFASFIPVVVRPGLHKLIQITGSLCLAVISWRLWVKGGEMLHQGDTTAVLELAIWPLLYYMSLLAAVTSLILLLIMRQKESSGGAGDI